MTSEPDPGVVVGDDGLARPAWASVDPLLREYYDTEWGMPVTDERGVFERVSLEGFQAGLSWATMLLDVPGIGPWTADYLLVRALQHPDTFAPGDLVARRALGLGQEAAAACSRAWTPYRSYALLHLWTDAAYL